MLDLIRKKQKTTLVQVVFWVIIATFIGTIFLVWGKGNDQSQDVSVAAQVNGTDISFDEFKSTYSQMYNFYKKIYGQNFTPELEKQIGLSLQSIQSLIDQTLLLQEADRMKLRVSEQDMVQAIAAVPAFQVDGVFSKERYIEVLSYQRMKPEVFEQIQRRQMLIRLAQEQLKSVVDVTDEDIVAEYRRINEKINLEYVTFAAEQFVDKVQLSDEQIKQYYDANKESLRIPEQVELVFVQLKAENYRDEVTFTDADVDRYYNRHLTQYAVPEQASAAHILIKVPADADDKVLADKKEQAEQILSAAQTADFALLAKKYSEDTATAVNGGDLGFFKRGEMVPAFEDAAFVLEKGAVTLVRSRFGYHIIKGQGYIEAGFKPLAEVLQEVQTGLINDLATRLAYEKAMDAYNVNRKDGGIAAATKELGLPAISTGLFSKGESIPFIGANEELSARAFSKTVGQLLSPVKTDQGIFLCGIAQKVDSYIPELDKVKNQVVAALNDIEAVKLAQQAANAALKKVIGGSSLSDVVPSGGKIAETGLFSRAMNGFVPKLGNVQGLADTAFGLSIKNPVADRIFAAGSSFYLVRLKQLQPVDPNALSQEESDKLRNSVLRTKQDTVMKEKLTSLKESADIVISPAILHSIEGK